MRNKKEIQKHLKGRVNRENLWFFSENSILNESPVPEKKSGMGDSLRMVPENYDPFMLQPADRTKLKKECNFVVDWQLSGSF